jgi:hypothetical protein
MPPTRWAMARKTHELAAQALAALEAQNFDQAGDSR